MPLPTVPRDTKAASAGARHPPAKAQASRSPRGPAATGTSTSPALDIAGTHPGANVRLISANGPQFIARDFRHVIRLVGMTHVLTSSCYPQSSGKIERYHLTSKHPTIRPKTPKSLEEARVIVGEFVEDHDHHRLRHPRRQACGSRRDHP